MIFKFWQIQYACIFVFDFDVCLLLIKINMKSLPLSFSLAILILGVLRSIIVQIATKVSKLEQVFSTP